MHYKHFDSEHPEEAERSWAAGLEDERNETTGAGGRGDGYAAAAAAYKKAFGHLNLLGTAFRQFCQERCTTRRTTILGGLQEQVHALKEIFAQVHMEILATFCVCLGKLVQGLGHQLANPNPSVLRTLSNAIDFLRFALSNVNYRRCLEKLPLKVLVVEDDAVCRRAMLLALGIGDLHVTSCEDGHKALEVLRHESFDVIFTDIMMPAMDGLEMTKELRQMPLHRTTPVVFVTALSDFDVRAKSMLCGGCDFIAKPIISSELVVKAFSFALRHRVVLDMATRSSTETHAQDLLAERRLGVFHVGEDRRIHRANKDAASLLGFELEELQDKLISEIFPPELQDAASENSLAEALFPSARRSSATLQARRKDGSALALIVTFRDTVQNGTRIHMLLLREASPSGSNSAAPGCNFANRIEIPVGAVASLPTTPAEPQEASVRQPLENPAEPATLQDQRAVIHELRCEIERLRAQVEELQAKEAQAARCWEEAQSALDAETARRLELEESLKRAREVEYELGESPVREEPLPAHRG